MEDYISQKKSQLLDSLENQVRFSQLVAVIVGDKGIGKSFLLVELQQRLEDEVMVARIDAGLAMTENQLEKTISLQLGLSWQDSDTSLEQRIKNDLSQKTLITIDDAHKLSSSCLNFILQLNQKQLEFHESVIFILLAGDNSLPSLISETEVYGQHQDMCVVFQVDPIEFEETQPLIAAMGHANIATLDGLYDEKKLNYFWQLSKGNPAELNYHVSRWIAEHSPSKVVEVVSEEPTSFSRSFLYVAIALGLMTVLIFQDEINQLISPPKTVTSTGLEKTKLDSKTIGDLSGKKKTKLIKTENQDEDLQANEQKGEEKLNQEMAADIVEKSDINSTTSAGTNKKKIVEEENPAPISVTDTKSLPLKIPSDEIEPKHEIEFQAEVKPEAFFLSEDEQELLLTNESHYTLQWAGLSNQKAAENLVKNHKLKSKMKIYRRVQQGSILYLIVSDDFSSRQAAEAALRVYKNNGISESPWIKSMRAVKNEIKALNR